MVSGARSVKGASAGPRTLLTPLTRGLQLLAYPRSVAQPCPAPPQVTGQRILTPGLVFGSVVSPVWSPLTLSLGQVCQQVGLQRAGPGHSGLGGPCAPCIPLSYPGTALLWGPAMLREGEGLLVQQSGCGLVKDPQSGWGPPKNPARLLPPSLFTVSAPP